MTGGPERASADEAQGERKRAPEALGARLFMAGMPAPLYDKPVCLNLWQLVCPTLQTQSPAEALGARDAHVEMLLQASVSARLPHC